MHTFQSMKNPNTTFHFNSDMSGDVVIYVKNPETGDTQITWVEGKALVEFVFEEFLKPLRIEAVENEDVDEFLRDISS